MATSLMNDSVYVYNIRNNLCNMAETIFVYTESSFKHLEEDMHITQGEIEDILEKKD